MYNVYFFHCYSFLYLEICGLLGPKYLKGGSLPYPTLSSLSEGGGLVNAAVAYWVANLWVLDSIGINPHYQRGNTVPFVEQLCCLVPQVHFTS